MYNTLEFFKMLRLLQADLSYSRIKDPEEKMRYFVRKHHSSITKYIKNSMKVLKRSIEKNERVALEVLVPEWTKVFIEHAQALYMDCSAKVLETNCEKIQEFITQILDKISFSWDDKDSLFKLAIYYGMRSLIFMIQKKENEFTADYKHMVYLVNELTEEYLQEQLAGNHLIKMFLQIAFILNGIHFPFRPNAEEQKEFLNSEELLHEFVENVKCSVNKYSQELNDDGSELKRDPILDKIVIELCNETELKHRLYEHLESRDWKVFITLFELSSNDMNYEQILSKIYEFNESVYNEMYNESNLSQLMFDLNKKVVLEETEMGGRCYVADSHIQNEEKILIEKPISCVLFQDYFHKLCSTCQKKITTAFPCSSCTEMVFCSLECSKIASKEYHWLECGCYSRIVGNDQFTVPHAVRLYSIVGTEPLLKQIQQHENEKLRLSEPKPVKTNAEIVQNYIEHFNGLTKSSFCLNGDDEDQQTNEDKQIFSESIDSLLVHRWSRQNDREIIHSIWSLNVIALFILRNKLPMDYIDKHNMGKFASLLEVITCRLLSICTNGFGWLDVLDEDNYNGEEYLRLGSSICFVGSFFNHSCKPNVTWTISKDIGLRMYSVRPIEPKELLCISYGPRYPTSFNERQKSLKDNYCFLCQCELCLSEASELPTTLRCLSPDQICNGPLVLNRHHSCLKCGYKASYAEYSLYLNRLNAFRNDFKTLYKKLEFKHGKSNGTILNKVAFYTSGALKRKTQKFFLNLKGIIQNTDVLLSSIERLRQAYDNIHEVVYPNSFNFLEYSVKMLKAYKWENYPKNEKIIEIVKYVIGCLENAHSDEILSSEVGDDIVRNIEFCAEYFAEYFNDILPKGDRDNSVMNAIETLKRIDMTLVNILKPIAHNYSQSHDGSGDNVAESAKDKATATYVNMFLNAQKRIQMFDNE